MAFVDGLAKLIGIDSNQVFFLICQIFAIFCGCVLRVYIPPGSSRSKQRHLFEFIIGVLVLYMGYGPYIIHLVIQAIPAYLMLVFLPLSFAQYGILIFSMAYLSAIHIYQLYTGNHSSVDISAPLMVQTQKLSSLAFNINDGVRIAAGLPVIRECHKLNAIARRPRLLQLGGYLFCFHNCMIGPSMFFADYLRFIEGREADRILDTDLQWRFNQKKDEIRVARAELLKQLKLLLLHTLLIVWAFSNFKPDHLLDDDFARKTFWQKYIYVTIACFAFRQRFYFAWTISCVANLCAGFGFSGFDDHGEPEYRFAANIHFLPIEREVLSIHVGQAGVQIGNAIWELYCAEHAVGMDGLQKSKPMDQECQSTFFQASPRGQCVPRSIFIDLEASVIDEIRVGPWRKLYHPDRLITGYEDAANNFARGFFTVGKLIISPILNEVRKCLESCEAPQGIIMYRSLGGGTGAGLTAALLDVMSDYRKLTKIEIPVYPSPSLSNSLVEPYNSLLGEHFAMEDIQLGLLMDNEALYDICSRFLAFNTTTYTSINRLIAQATSAITASLRFPNILNGDLNVIQTNLVPYPRIHFPLSNFAPCISPEKAEHEALTTRELTRSVFDKENQMVKVDPSYGKFMSCTLLYRGDVSPSQVYLSLMELKSCRGIEFVDWCPTGFKVGISSSPPVSIVDSRVAQCDKNVVMLANNSAVGQAWQRLTHKFYLLFSKRSFIHWYVGEGMEESEFNDALINMTSLVKDYEEASMDSKTDHTIS